MVRLWLQRWHLAPSGVGSNADGGPFFQRRGSVFEEPDLSAEWLNQQRQPVAIAQHILSLLRFGGSDLGIG